MLDMLWPTLGASLMNGSLLGTMDKGTSSGTSSSRFDMKMLPEYYKALGVTDQSSAGLANMLRQISGQRTASLQGNLDDQLNALQGYGNQAITDINRRYNSQQGGVGQSLANRGLYNSTVAPGMSALVERERNSALGQEQDRQRQLLAGVYGQRAQMMDQVQANQNQALAQLGFQDYGLRSILPQAIASSRVSTQKTNSVQKKGGLFSRLFG